METTMMKRVLIAGVLLSVVLIAYAQSPTPSTEVVRFAGSSGQYVAINKDGTITASGGIQASDVAAGIIVNGDIATNAAIAASKISGTAVTQATLYQSDTNETTTVTSYTPAFIGQVLVGGAGSGTNGVWVSKGVTTNDWVQVAP